MLHVDGEEEDPHASRSGRGLMGPNPFSFPRPTRIDAESDRARLNQDFLNSLFWEERFLFRFWEVQLPFPVSLSIYDFSAKFRVCGCHTIGEMGLLRERLICKACHNLIFPSFLHSRLDYCNGSTANFSFIMCHDYAVTTPEDDQTAMLLETAHYFPSALVRVWGLGGPVTVRSAQRCE